MFDQIYSKYKTKIKGFVLKTNLALLIFIILYILLFIFIIVMCHDIPDIKNNSLGFTIIWLSEIILFLLGAIISFIYGIKNIKSTVISFTVIIIIGLCIILYTNISYPILKLFFLMSPIFFSIICLKKSREWVLPENKQKQEIFSLNPPLFFPSNMLS